MGPVAGSEYGRTYVLRTLNKKLREEGITEEEKQKLKRLIVQVEAWPMPGAVPVSTSASKGIGCE